MKTRTERIEDKLLALGVKPNLLGFGYTVDAVEIWIERGGRMSITKELYPEIAAKNGTTRSKVERDIRHAIETAYELYGGEDFAALFGTKDNPEKGKLTNGEFIATLALLVAREEMGDAE
jgi:two-component system response regulator (stage 0 sporulation protein A)